MKSILFSTAISIRFIEFRDELFLTEFAGAHGAQRCTIRGNDDRLSQLPYHQHGSDLLIKFVDLKCFFQDLHLVDLEEFKYTGTNLTAFRMVDPENEEVRKTVKTWNLKERFPGRHFGGGSILKVIK